MRTRRFCTYFLSQPLPRQQQQQHCLSWPCGDTHPAAAAAAAATAAVRCLHMTTITHHTSPRAPAAGPSPPLQPSATGGPLAAHDTGEEDYCLLCDTDIAADGSTWEQHCALPSHGAREAVCRLFAMPERGASLLASLDRHLRVDFAEMDATYAHKVRRRQARLLSALRKLVEEGVVAQALPVWETEAQRTPDKDTTTTTATAASKDVAGGEGGEGRWVVRDRFCVYLLAGEALAKAELTDHAARLMPSLPAAELRAVVEDLLSSLALRALFESMQWEELLTAAPSSSSGDARARPLPPAAEAATVLSVLGELQHFSTQERPRDVADRRAAAHLVLHVLATHCIENLLAELLHGRLQRLVDEGTPVWRRYEARQQERLLRGLRGGGASPVLQAAPSPAPASSPAQPAGAMTAQLMAYLPLSPRRPGQATLLGRTAPAEGPVVAAGSALRRVRWGEAGRDFAQDVPLPSTQPPPPGRVVAPRMGPLDLSGGGDRESKQPSQAPTDAKK